MKLRQILEDTGADGKSFEKKFIQALQMVGLEFDINRASGALWDIRPKGQGWSRLLTNQNINIKVARTKWLFGSSELSKLLPWNDIDSGMDLRNAQEIVKKLLDKKGVSQNVFLKPKDETVQQQIIQAVDAQNVDALNRLMIKSNFYAEKLGNDYEIVIKTKENYITSIILVRNGKPFARSERPRSLGGSQGFVAFKAPSDKLGDVPRKLKAG